MTQDTYRFAYEEATSELREIVAQFDQLRARKERMESVLEALKPLLADQPIAETSTAYELPALTLNTAMPEVSAAPEVHVEEEAPFLVPLAAVELTPESVAAFVQESEPVPAMELMQETKPEPEIAEPVFAEQSSDPFQRRIDNALRHGFGGKDSRVLSLGLNGLLTRA